jgi:hypothetical protein
MANGFQVFVLADDVTEYMPRQLNEGLTTSDYCPRRPQSIGGSPRGSCHWDVNRYAALPLAAAPPRPVCVSNSQASRLLGGNVAMLFGG